jgi:hypothetical protein
MPNALYSLSDLQVFIILVAITIALSLFAVFITKRYISHKLHYQDNATVGSISGLIGIIYGVLTGFICLYLINNQDHASYAVQAEADASANIYRSTGWLPQPAQANVANDLKNYLSLVINKEWPLMRDFKNADQGGDPIIKKMFDDLRTFIPATSSDSTNLQNLMTQINELYNARHQRLSLSSSQLSPELWEVILMGTILIIAINYAFKVNFTLHLYAVTAFSIMAASMIFLLVTLDRPFQGEFVVTPEPMKEVLTSMS